MSESSWVRLKQSNVYSRASPSVRSAFVRWLEDGCDPPPEAKKLKDGMEYRKYRIRVDRAHVEEARKRFPGWGLSALIRFAVESQGVPLESRTEKWVYNQDDEEIW